jgi:hypothetical protein
MRRSNQSGHAMQAQGAQERAVLQAWRHDAAASNSGAEGGDPESRLQANCDAAADSREMGKDRGGGMMGKNRSGSRGPSGYAERFSGSVALPDAYNDRIGDSVPRSNQIEGCARCFKPAQKTTCVNGNYRK